MTTNLLDLVRAEARLTVLAHLKAQLAGDEPADLGGVLRRRLEAVFATHLTHPIRDAVDTALTSSIHAAVDGSLLSTLDLALDRAVDTAISGALDGLHDLARDRNPAPAEENPATLPITTEPEPAPAATEDEPAILTMPDAAQVTNPAVEEMPASEQNSPETATGTAGEPKADPTAEAAATTQAEPLPAEAVPTEPAASGTAEEPATQTQDAGITPPIVDAGEVSPEVADAIRRLHAEGRTVRSISRTLKVRELLVRFVTDNQPAG